MNVNVFVHETGTSAEVDVSHDDSILTVKQNACRALQIRGGMTELRAHGCALDEEAKVADTHVSHGDELELRCTYADVKCPAEYSYETAAFAVTLSPCGKLCLLAGAKHVAIWETETGCRLQCHLSRQRLAAYNYMAAMSMCGQWLFVASHDPLVQLDAATGAKVRTLSHLYTCSVYATLCGRYVVSSHCRDDVVIMHNLHSGTTVKRFEHMGLKEASGLAVADDSTWLCTVGEDGVRVWSMETYEGELVIASESCTCVAISPFCEYFAVGRSDGPWSFHKRDGTLLLQSSQVAAIDRLLFSPCGKWILSHTGEDDGLCQLDTATGTRVRRITDCQTSFAISPCSRFLFALRSDNAIHVCELDGTDDPYS